MSSAAGQPDSLDIVIYTQGLPITGDDPAEMALGGSETAVVSMARALTRRGHAVTVACSIETPVERQGTTFLPHRELMPYVRARGCDLFLSCRFHDVLEQPIPARMIGLWYHDVAAAYPPEAFRRAQSKASFSLFLSQFHLEDFERRIRGLRCHAIVTSNGVDFEALEKAALASSHGAGADKLTFAYASRPERGLDTLLREIWPRLHVRFPEAELLVCSYDVPSQQLSTELKRHYALCDHLIRVTPGVLPAETLSRSAFWQRLSRCRALLYPTAFPEVSCMVALEAQALGVPVVTTDAFALRETVGFRDTRVDAPWRSAAYRDAFLARATRLVEDDAFFQKARAAGRDHVRPETHSWDAIARSWESAIQERFRRRFHANKAGVLRRLLHRSDLMAARRLVKEEARPETVFDPFDLERLRANWLRAASARSDPAPDFPEKAERLRELTAWLRDEKVKPTPARSAQRQGVVVIDGELSRVEDPAELLEDAERRAEVGVLGVVPRNNATRFHDLGYRELRQLLRSKKNVRLEYVSWAEGSEEHSSAWLFAYHVDAGNGSGRLDVETKLMRTPPLPKVSACILVKNEESHLRRCIESFAPIVDEIVIGDTGSTDRTWELAESMGFVADGASRRRIVAIDFQDFAQARNALLTKVDGDYIFWQDADEVLMNGGELRRWLDDNVFFDAIQIEQRHVVADGAVAPGYPSRCFRPSTPEGPLAWHGCVHELVERGENALAERVLTLTDVYVLHTGYLFPTVRQSKATGRNWNLLLADRRKNPDRFMGYTLGMREYLELACAEIGEAGSMTKKAYECLNLGYEIWHHYLRHFPPHFQTHALEISRRILEVLAEHGLVVRATGRVPIHVDYSFAGKRGVLDVDGRDVPRGRLHYADVDEVRRELNRRCDELEIDLGPALGCELQPDALEATVRFADRMLAPELFGLSADGSPLGGRETYLESTGPNGSTHEPPVVRLELSPDLFETAASDSQADE